MKQYIITEEQLWELVTSFNCNRHEIRKSVRSCPYNPQAEREKVLDEVLTKTHELHNSFECPYLNQPCPEGKICEVCCIEYVIAELRKGGEQE